MLTMNVNRLKSSTGFWAGKLWRGFSM